MRSVSAVRNRSALVILGLLALVASAWIIIAATGSAARLPGWGGVLADPTSTPADIASAHQSWLLPVGIVVAVLVAILGLVLVLSQVPGAPPSSTLRISDEAGEDLGGIEPAVLSRALGERVEQVSGVQSSNIQVIGAASAPVVRAEVTVAEDADVAWVASTIRSRIADDTTSALGHAPVRLDLLVHLSGRTTRTQRVDVAPAA